MLGFEVHFTHAWEHDDATLGLALMERDGVEIQLQVCECGDYRDTGLGFFKLEVENLEVLYDEYVAAGAKLRFELTTQDWGVRDFQSEDPEGNRIDFLEPVGGGEDEGGDD